MIGTGRMTRYAVLFCRYLLEMTVQEMGVCRIVPNRKSRIVVRCVGEAHARGTHLTDGVVLAACVLVTYVRSTAPQY